MYDQEKIKPYDGEGEKGKLIAEMFDNIAPTYDTLNHRLSWDIDKGWRKKAIRQLLPFHPEQMLDIATGTGDFAILAARELKPRHLVGADISEGMMAIGREKVKEAGLDGVISFRKEDCLSLSFPDETFDAVTAAFGIRNFQNLDKGLAEICRVLKKGGHLSIVEVHLQGQERIRVPQQDSRGVPAGRADDGDIPQGRLLPQLFPPADFRYLHDVFCGEISICKVLAGFS